MSMKQTMDSSRSHTDIFSGVLFYATIFFSALILQLSNAKTADNTTPTHRDIEVNPPITIGRRDNQLITKLPKGLAPKWWEGR